MQIFRALFSWNWCLGVADISVCRQFFPTFILTPPHAAPLLLHSPPSIPPPFHPTRDYWFTHNLLFNIREQTFQNLCNLSISMGLSVHLQRGCVCGSFCYTWIALKNLSLKSFWPKKFKKGNMFMSSMFLYRTCCSFRNTRIVLWNELIAKMMLFKLIYKQ